MRSMDAILLQNRQFLLREERSKACKYKIRLCVIVLNHRPEDAVMG